MFFACVRLFYVLPSRENLPAGLQEKLQSSMRNMVP
jgi:hypothetical protein